MSPFTLRWSAFALALAGSIVVGCGGKMPAHPADLVGSYTVQSTCVVTMRNAVGEGPSYLIGNGQWGTETYTLSEPQDSRRVRVTSAYGCTLMADVRSGVVVGGPVDCDPPAPDARMLMGGVVGQSYPSFYLDPKLGAFHAVDIDFFGYGAPGQPGVQQQNYAVCEGRVVGAPRPPGTHELHYQADMNNALFSVENAATGPCLDLVGKAPTEGVLQISFGSDRSDMVVYEPGVGCTVHARSSDSSTYIADSADCALSDTGVSQLGVITRHFETWRLDLKAKTWNYASSIQRQTSSGTVMQQCARVKADVSGDLTQ